MAPQYVNSKYSFPSALEQRVSIARSQQALGYLKVEGLNVKYTGPGEDDTEAATIRTNYPVPPDCPVYYFEVTIKNEGEHGFIGIGYQTEDVLLSRLPGWDAHSYGYHGDDGFAFGGSGQGVPYGPRFTAGDVIGAMFCRVDNSIRFFKNGVDLGLAFKGIPEERIFPCVGLRTRGEEVKLTLSKPFVTALDEAVEKYVVNQVLQTVNETPVPTAAPCGAPLLAQLLHDHLIHHRCWQTAALLRRDLTQISQQASIQKSDEAGPMDAESTPPAVTEEKSDVTMSEAGLDTDAAATSETVQQGSRQSTGMLGSVSVDFEQAPHVATRQAAYEMVTHGRALDARNLLEQHYGAKVWENNSALDFRLKVSHFCELVRPGGSAALEAAVAYGRAVLAPHSPKSSHDEELLCDALSLLAYEDPVASPCGHLLSQNVRNSLAEDVDRAILAACGLPATSPLERLAAQTIVTIDSLQQKNHSQALLLDVWKLIFKRGASSSS